MMTIADFERVMNLNGVIGSAYVRPGALVMRVHPDSLALAIELINRTTPPGLYVEFQTLGMLEQSYSKEFIFIHA